MQSKKIRITLFKTPKNLTKEVIENEDLKTEEYDLQFNKLRLFTTYIKPTYILEVKDPKVFKKSTYLTSYRKMVKEGIAPYPKGVTWKIINTGEVLNIEDIQKDPDVGPAGKDLGHHGVLGIPIALEEKVIGVIWFSNYKVRRFDDGEVDLLTSIGNQIAIAIAKAKLYGDLTRKSRYEEIISIVTKSVHQSINLQEVLENAVEAMNENIDVASNVAVFMAEGEEAILKSYRGLPDWFMKRLKRIPYPKGFTWKTIIEGKLSYCPDVDKDTISGPAGRKLGTKSYVSIPISYEGKTVECINVNSYQKNGFDEEEMNLLENVAHQIEIAVKNARQAEALKEAHDVLEKRVEERTAELSRSNAELNAFAYTVAHDLRSPLRAMQGFSTALVEDYSERLDSTGIDYANRIMDSSQRMDKLIQDLLAYSRLSSDEMRIEPVNLQGVVIDALLQLEAEVKESDAKITVKEPIAQVTGHHATLIQMVANLLTNALKFVDKGIKPRVLIWSEEREDCVRLWFEDNGIGISPEYQKRIFNVFERLHGVEAYPGTGIGLALVRKGVEFLGGRVGVESILSQGSKFWIELPKVAEETNPREEKVA